jgi:ferrous iron transport protein B
VLTKTASRMQWYFVEVLPLFLLASVILWIGDLTGLLQAALRGLTPVVALLGCRRRRPSRSCSASSVATTAPPACST